MKGLAELFLKNCWILLLFSALYAFWMELGEHEKKVKNLESKVPIIKTKIKKAKADVEALKEFKNEIDRAREKVESVRKDIEKVQKQLPNAIFTAEILAVFEREAKLINMQKVLLAPRDEESHGFYYSKKFELTGKGTFLQFLIFFERIAQNERIMNVSDLVLNSSGNEQKGRFQLIDGKTLIEVYRYNPSYEEEIEQEEVAEKKEVPKKKFKRKRKGRRK